MVNCKKNIKVIDLLDWDTTLFFVFLFDNPFFDTEISKTGSGYGVMLFNYVLNINLITF